MEWAWASSKTAPPPPGHVFTHKTIGGDDALATLDTLVALMAALTLAHAYTTKATPLALAALGLGLLTEHASLRLGGTHCHASSPHLGDISDCSSLNSVLYYLPWVYSCVTLGRRLVDETSWAFPLLTGLLFFGMCGVYECQGPIMGWWLWPFINHYFFLK